MGARSGGAASEVSVELKYDEAKNKLSFKVSNGDKPCASGRIVFEVV